jgi:hypothetical protein
MDALRVLAKSNDPDRIVLVEININDFLKKSESDWSRRRWLERLRNALHDEEMANRRGENWRIAKDYVRSLLHEMSSQVFQREDETRA